jgi:hypothetical protein
MKTTTIVDLVLGIILLPVAIKYLVTGFILGNLLIVPLVNALFFSDSYLSYSEVLQIVNVCFCIPIGIAFILLFLPGNTLRILRFESAIFFGPISLIWLFLGFDRNVTVKGIKMPRSEFKKLIEQAKREDLLNDSNKYEDLINSMKKAKK